MYIIYLSKELPIRKTDIRCEFNPRNLIGFTQMHFRSSVYLVVTFDIARVLISEKDHYVYKSVWNKSEMVLFHHYHCTSNLNTID